MSVKLSKTAFAVEVETLTQNLNIKGQLDAGIRMFDRKPTVITAKGWRNNLGAEHYSNTNVALIG